MSTVYTIVLDALSFKYICPSEEKNNWTILINSRYKAVKQRNSAAHILFSKQSLWCERGYWMRAFTDYPHKIFSKPNEICWRVCDPSECVTVLKEDSHAGILTTYWTVRLLVPAYARTTQHGHKDTEEMIQITSDWCISARIQTPYPAFYFSIPRICCCDSQDGASCSQGWQQ